MGKDQMNLWFSWDIYIEKIGIPLIKPSQSMAYCFPFHNVFS